MPRAEAADVIPDSLANICHRFRRGPLEVVPVAADRVPGHPE